MEVNITQEANFVGKSSIPTIINGAGIKNIEQTKTSTEDGGTNILTVTTTDGEETEFVVKNGSKGETGPQGLKGDKGDTGAAFTYDMFTTEQLELLKGPKGDKGDTGEQGIQGIQGLKGDKGDAGETGPQGVQGPKGDKGDTGAAFTYDMFTAEQLASLVGPKGDKGDTGEQGIQGPKGDKGDTGVQGPKGDTPVKGTDYFTDAEKQEMANTAASLVDIPTPDWNQNDSTANDYIKNRPFYTEGKNTTLLSEQEITFSSDGYELSFPIEIDKNYIVEFDGVQYKCKAYKKEIIAGEIYIPCINTTSDIFYIEGTYMHASDNATHTVAIYEYNTIVKTLDEEFIPDTIARTSDVPIVDQILDLNNLTTNAISSRSVGYALNSIHSSISSINNDIDLLHDNPSDWDLNDASSPGYIRNKTHYIIYNTRQEITATDLGIALGDPNNTNKYTFKIDNLLYTKYSISYDSSDTAQRYPIVTAGTYRVKVDKTGSTSPVYTPSDVTWTIYSQSVLSIKQLDEQFIPDTIARTSDIPTTDTDVTADGANPVSGAAVAAYVAENGGTGGEFRLLRRVTISEEVASMIITEDEEGNPFSCVELALQAYLVPNTAADGKIVEVCGYVDGNTAKDYWLGYMGSAPKSGESISRAEINIRTGKSQKASATNLIPFNGTQITNYSGQSELNALQNHSSVAWAYAPITENSFITGIIIKGGGGSMLGAGCEFVIFGR